MTHDEFKCWIRGYLTLSTENFMDINQPTIIKNHINLVKSVDGFLDFTIEHFLAVIEDNIKTKTILNLSDLKETWSHYLTLASS